MATEAVLPPLRTVAAALRATTEVLAHELADPSSVPPDWNDFQWHVAEAVAGMQGVSALLSSRLRWPGPADWQRFLSAQSTHTLSRHRRIEAFLSSLDFAARQQGIAMVALKGVALHELGLYPAGARPMADIDLLVRPGDVESTIALFSDLGYHETYATWKERVFEPLGAQEPGGFGEHCNNPLKIELHTRIAERLPVREVDITQWVFPQRAHPGLNRYPSTAALMRHLLLHAAGNMRSRSIRLIQLHDIALLSARLRSVDWANILGDPGDSESWWLFPPLSLVARYYPAAIAPDILDRARRCCPGLLRFSCRRQLLSDASLSSLWIRAFPGIEWARSPLEALRYVRARVLTDPEVIVGRKIAERQLWGSNNGWVRASQARRMARWLCSRPPRVQTLAPVRAAWSTAAACGTDGNGSKGSGCPAH